jgi:hypothetical protein
MQNTSSEALPGTSTLQREVYTLATPNFVALSARVEMALRRGAPAVYCTRNITMLEQIPQLKIRLLREIQTHPDGHHFEKNHFRRKFKLNKRKAEVNETQSNKPSAAFPNLVRLSLL